MPLVQLGYTWERADYWALVQSLLAICGIAAALIPLWKTTNLVKDNNDLLKRRLLGNDLLILLPDLGNIERELSQALKEDSRDSAERLLASFGSLAGRIAGQIKNESLAEASDFETRLNEARKAARSAKVEIITNTNRNLKDILPASLKKISSATHEAGELIGILQKETN